ncbi:hypothetical protein K437DRAFT_78473 [Tilletiaria anomala UBC 951]|uniref:Uncharacterized protein n=1 Tax=Tilletiaria anomala (strain ATCC 24038 / CBS 436.72 / UBC 951) TaxID=1037660 RepID=A0A066WEJ9_TILAU|nr:uncharacterized protein K437DRAFT_78473 [Tilletiaria anomala UBC 951]KDN49190.1 hypothetical protein K437DRAFT_78473 [Tilletiaria anomala UBC 951]
MAGRNVEGQGVVRGREWVVALNHVSHLESVDAIHPQRKKRRRRGGTKKCMLVALNSDRKSFNVPTHCIWEPPLSCDNIGLSLHQDILIKTSSSSNSSCVRGSAGDGSGCVHSFLFSKAIHCVPNSGPSKHTTSLNDAQLSLTKHFPLDV